jgi:hypothetical protein
MRDSALAWNRETNRYSRISARKVVASSAMSWLITSGRLRFG